MKKLFVLLAILGLMTSVQAQKKCSNLFVEASPSDGYLYFASNRTGVSEIYSSKLDGSELKQITKNSQVNCLYPSISPDGTKLLYQYGDYGNGAVYLLDLKGGSSENISQTATHAGHPSWSPDGSMIVFERWPERRDQFPEIYIMNSNAGDLKRLTTDQGAYWNSAPLFNPAGDKIYFQKGLNADNYYVRMNIDGSDLDTITSMNEFGTAEFGLNFSPDGNKIIFSTTEWRGYNNGCDIVIADPDGSNWKQMTNAKDKEYFYYPEFYKDSTQILYSYAEDVMDGIFQIMHRKLIDNYVPNQVTTCNNVSIESLKEDIKIYPNPASNILHIEGAAASKSQELCIYNTLGIEVKTITEQFDLIDVTDLPSGNYFLLLKMDGIVLRKAISIVR